MSNLLTKKVVFSCFLASCLEIYDFVIFSFFSEILQQNYFVFLESSTVLIVNYVLFGVGYVFRPVGSLIFGYIGDVFGRQRTLVLSVALMGSASLTMCLLPSYESIGILSCWIIVAVRIVQGISVGGEFTGALVFAIEHGKKQNTCLIGGILASGGAGGVLLATVISNLLKNQFVFEGSWRLAFLLGFSLSVVGYVIRKKLVETPAFQMLRHSRKVMPLVEGFRNNKMECITTIFMAAANGTAFYFAVVFLPNYLRGAIGSNADWVPLAVTIPFLLFGPLSGYLADRWGKAKMLFWSALLMALYVPFALNEITQTSNFFVIICILFIYCAIFASVAATVNTLAVEIFPTSVRMSCSSVCYSLGMGFIGGTVPTVSAFIEKIFGPDPLYLSLYVSIVCIFASISAYFLLKKAESVKRLT